MKHVMHVFKVNTNDWSVLLHFLVSQVESYLERHKKAKVQLYISIRNLNQSQSANILTI